jgi:ribonuclease D
MSRRARRRKARTIKAPPRMLGPTAALERFTVEQLRARLTVLENRELGEGRKLDPDDRLELRALRQIPGVRRAYHPVAFKAIADAMTKRARRGLKVLELRARGGLPPLDRPPAPADPAPDPTPPEAA